MAGKSKGVFTDQLEDLDELIPPPIPKPSPAAESSAADQSAAPAPDTVGQVGAAAPLPGSQQRPRRRRAVGSVPTAEVAPEVHRALRRLTNREKGRDPITARTFAQVVLDAIEDSQERLSTFWKTPTQPTGGGGGLFSRRPAASARRRRHSEPPARIPLTGLNPSDAATIDTLVEQWQAPSRSALVEEALRLYEPLWSATRRGKRSDVAESA